MSLIPLRRVSFPTALFMAALLTACGGQPVVEKAAEPQPVAVQLTPLFAQDGVVKDGWTVRHWADVSQPPKQALTWEVKEGVLHGTGGRKPWVGTWLLSERQYENFVIDYEFHLGGARGNGGLALRAPLVGDPAFDGMEMQMTDPRFQYGFFPNATPSQLTGGIYLAIAPKDYVYRANEWNHARVELRGNSLRAWMNGKLIHDVNLDEQRAEVKRHEGDKPVLPVAQRPRRGHIGFQDLGGEGDHLQVRNARFAVLE